MPIQKWRTNMTQSVYIKGLGWTTQVAMVHVSYICSGVYGCGQAHTSSAQVQEPDAEALYAKFGNPVPAPCTKCDTSSTED